MQKVKNNEPTRREVLEAFASLIISKLSHEEIDMLCTALLHANMVCKKKCKESVRQNELKRRRKKKNEMS